MKYAKAWAALIVGVGLQLLPIAANALDEGLIPNSWAPWVHVALAVGTALGVAAGPANKPAHRADPAP